MGLQLGFGQVAAFVFSSHLETQRRIFSLKLDETIATEIPGNKRGARDEH